MGKWYLGSSHFTLVGIRDQNPVFAKKSTAGLYVNKILELIYHEMLNKYGVKAYKCSMILMHDAHVNIFFPSLSVLTDFFLK